MHINRNVLAEYQKIKKLKKTEERDQLLPEFMGKVYKHPSTNSDRSQDVAVSLTLSKCNFKSDLAEKQQQLSKTRKCYYKKVKT